jgi:multidrug transporter EmrE-like cation transporter
MSYWTLLFVFGYIVAFAGSNLLFKYTDVARDSSGTTHALIAFAAANVVGFIAASCMPFALRGQNPSVIYALCHGGGFLALQIASYYLFRPYVSASFVTGVLLIAVGLALVSFQK